MTEHAMIAFLPTNGDWCKQDLPHMTLVYAGKVDELSPGDFNAMGKDAISAGRLTGSFVLPVTGVEEFGDETEKVDVLTLHPNSQLLAARRLVEHWNRSQFKDFKPHATIGPAGSASEQVTDFFKQVGINRTVTLPSQLFFNRVGVFWGSRSLVFSLGDY